MRRAWLSSRVSSGPQERGGGHRRQESPQAIAAARRWCERNGYQLQPERLHFTGSAYKGHHMRPGAPQREWLERAIRGELGDRPALLVEQLDRLTRQAGHDAEGGLAELLYRAFPAGVVIADLGDGVTYSSEEFERNDRLLGELLEEARLAHRESVKKSRRLTSHWQQVREDMAAGRIVRPRQLAPWWITATSGSWQLNEHAPLARRIFDLALLHGCVITTRILNAEEVPTPGRKQGPRWTATFVNNTVRNPAAWGCCSLRGLEPLPGIFPPLISREQFDLVQARTRQRAGDLSSRGHRLEVRWIGAGLTRCVCGWAAGLAVTSGRRGRSYRYISCLRYRDHGRACPARLVPLPAATAHLLTRLGAGELGAMLTRPDASSQQEAQAAARRAHQAVEIAAERRQNAEAAVRAAVLRGQDNALLLEIANEARAAESAARQAAAEAQAAATAEGTPPAGPVQDAARELLQLVAAGQETAEHRRAINQGMADLGLQITLDSSQATAMLGLALGDDRPTWEPIVPQLALEMLQDGASGVSYWPDELGADWPA
jgi:DNA invertase Pin-like site-specific DNA recombinase